MVLFHWEKPPTFRYKRDEILFSATEIRSLVLENLKVRYQGYHPGGSSSGYVHIFILSWTKNRTLVPRASSHSCFPCVTFSLQPGHKNATTYTRSLFSLFHTNVTAILSLVGNCAVITMK